MSLVTFQNTNVYGLDTAIRSMRMPLQSFDKSDSSWDLNYDDYVDPDGPFHIGPNDLDLAHRLLTGGNNAHSKFLRSIHVYTEITAPAYFLSELDTYKIGTVRNSSSLQHKGASRDYTINDFAQDAINKNQLNDNQKALIDRVDSVWKELLKCINALRKEYKDTNDYTWFRMMRQMIPQSYLYTISYSANYQVLREIWLQRIKQPHRLQEWTIDFNRWLQSLPYARDLIFYEGENNERI